MIVDQLFFISLAIGLPIGMVLLGMQLTVQDFRDAITQPRALAAGVFGQLVLLPLLALVFVTFFPLSLPIKVGVVIMASTPGGPASNTISFIGHGNLSLALLLTVGTSIISVFTIPLVVNGGLIYLGLESVARLPVLPTIARSVVLVLIPVAVGILIRAKRPGWVAKTERLTKVVTSLLIVFFLGFGLYSHWDVFEQNFNLSVFGGVVVFSTSLMLSAFYTARLFGANARDRFTVAIETVVHNAVLALLVVSYVGVPEAIVFCAYFGVFSILIALAGVALLQPGRWLNRETVGRVASATVRAAGQR